MSFLGTTAIMIYSLNISVLNRTVAFAGYGCPLQADIPVHGMMTKLQNDHPERRDELIKLLGIDVNWRMHQVSDGQRRRGN